VLRANAEFYKAFSARDLERMKSTWLPANHVQCIHPYDSRATGFNDVCSYWRRMFDEVSSSRRRITAEDVRIHVSGATATVVCMEQVASKSTKQPPYRSMIATNIFRKVGSRWLMVHRHVSPVIEAEKALADESLRKLTELQYTDFSFDKFMEVIQTIDPDESIRFRIFPNEDDDGDEEDEEVDDNDSDLDDLDNDQEAAKEATRDTWRAIRKLREQGRLSSEEAMTLLSHMIRTPGESVPERAHALLLTHVPEDEKELAWDDFAQLVAMEAKCMCVDSGSALGKPASGSARAGEQQGAT